MTREIRERVIVTRSADMHHVCKGNLTDLRRELHLSLARGNPK
jgi:hypothetical protein